MQVPKGKTYHYRPRVVHEQENRHFLGNSKASSANSVSTIHRWGCKFAVSAYIFFMKYDAYISMNAIAFGMVPSDRKLHTRSFLSYQLLLICLLFSVILMLFLYNCRICMGGPFEVVHRVHGYGLGQSASSIAHVLYQFCIFSRGLLPHRNLQQPGIQKHDCQPWSPLHCLG